MKLYRGERCRDGCRVTVDGQELSLRLDLRCHSPTGFEFGYGGSGPAQLALAILADALGDEIAQDCYQDFKWKVIAGFSASEWQLTEEEIRHWQHQHHERRKC